MYINLGMPGGRDPRAKHKWPKDTAPRRLTETGFAARKKFASWREKTLLKRDEWWHSVKRRDMEEYTKFARQGRQGTAYIDRMGAFQPAYGVPTEGRFDHASMFERLDPQDVSGKWMGMHLDASMGVPATTVSFGDSYNYWLSDKYSIPIAGGDKTYPFRMPSYELEKLDRGEVMDRYTGRISEKVPRPEGWLPRDDGKYYDIDKRYITKMEVQQEWVEKRLSDRYKIWDLERFPEDVPAGKNILEREYSKLFDRKFPPPPRYPWQKPAKFPYHEFKKGLWESRKPFLSQIDPRQYDPEFLFKNLDPKVYVDPKTGEIISGNLEKFVSFAEQSTHLQADIDPLNPSTSSSPWGRFGDQDRAIKTKTYMARRIAAEGIPTTGMGDMTAYEQTINRIAGTDLSDRGVLKYIEENFGDAKAVVGTMSKEDLDRALADIELGLNVDGSKIVEKTSRQLYFHNRGHDIYFGGSNAHIYSLDREQQRQYVKKVYGTTKILKDVETGKYPLLGRDLLNLGRIDPATFFYEELSRHRDLEPYEQFKFLRRVVSGRHKYKDPMFAGDMERRGFEGFASKLQKKSWWKSLSREMVNIENLTGRKRDIALGKTFGRYGQFSTMFSNLGKMWPAYQQEAGTAMVGGEDLVERMLLQRQLAEQSPAGTVLRGLGKKGELMNLRVEDITDKNIRDMSILLSGKSGTFVSTLDKMARKAAKAHPDYIFNPTVFDAHMIRKPIKMGTENLLYNIDLLTPGGKRLGTVPYDIAKGISPDIESGYIGKMLATTGYTSVASAKGGPQLYLTPGATAATSDFSGKELLSADKINKINVGRVIKGTIPTWTDPSDKLLYKAHPTKFFPKSKVDLTPGEGLTTGSKVAWAITGAAIVAGAMIGWSAYRSSKKQPMREEELPFSNYGDTGYSPVGANQQAMYPQTARISMNPSAAYSTNISVSSDDDAGMGDYRDIARTMSTVSQSALGAGKVNTNLQITDTSANMSSHAMQRRFAEYLRR